MSIFNNSTLESLSDDCLIAICCYLQFNDVLALGATCWTLRKKLCRSSPLWKNLVVAKYPFILSKLETDDYRLLFQSYEKFSSLWIGICPFLVPFKLGGEPSLAFCHSGNSILVACEHFVKRFALRRKQFLETCCVNFVSFCTCTAWNSAFNSIFLGFHNGAIFSWKDEERRGIRKLNKKSHGSISCLESESLFVASGTDQGIITLLDATTGKCLGTTRGHVGRINKLQFIESRSFVASFGQDHTGKVWSMDRLNSSEKSIGEMEVPQRIVSVDQREPQVIYVATERAIYVWDIRVGGITAILSESFSHSSLRRHIVCMKVLSNGVIVTGNSDGSLLCWPHYGSWSGIEMLAPSGIPITSIASDDYKFLLGWEDGSIRLFNNSLELWNRNEEFFVEKFDSSIKSLEIVEQDWLIVQEESGRLSALDFSVEGIESDCVVQSERVDRFLKWLNSYPVLQSCSGNGGRIASNQWWR